MTISRSPAACVLALGLSALPASAQETDLRSLFATPITIEREEAITSVPIEVSAGKLYIEAAVNDRRGRFIFDTGSPTVLTREFADSLGLRAVGRNTGLDANGRQVTMDIAVADAITLGGAVFRRVPIFIFDYSGLPLAPCLIGDGVIGSEILPGSAWRIDLEAGQLSIAGTASVLTGSGVRVEARLQRSGFPHAPIVAYELGGVTDRALFDTGSSEQLALFRQVFDNADVQALIGRETIRRGHGSEGESAGGHGDERELYRFGLTGLRLDGQPLGPLRATTRSFPPTLLGAGLLADHIVTLDYPGGRLLLEPRRQAEAAKMHPGYRIALIGDHAEVVQLFDGSAAAEAGLRLGDRVVSIRGRTISARDGADRCDLARWMLEPLDPAAANEVVVLREGQTHPIRIPARVPGAR